MARIAEGDDPQTEQVYAPGPALPRVRMGELLRRVSRSRMAALAGINLLFMLLVGAIAPIFVSTKNIDILITNMALESIVMAAVVMLLASGHFDLSVDGVVSVSAVIMGKLMTGGVTMGEHVWEFGAGHSPWLCVLVGMAAGIAVGLINGIVITKLRVNPFMATLATWWICIGTAYGLTKNITPWGFPESFQRIGQAEILGMSILIWYALVLIPLFTFILKKTKFGYHVYATGGNRRAARLYGVNVDRATIILYALVAAASAFMGVVFAARINLASPYAVTGMALRLIAAAVLGGVSLSGGEGSIPCAFLGLLLINMLYNATLMVGVSPYWQKAIVGVVLFGALILDAIRARRTPEREVGGF